MDYICSVCTKGNVKLWRPYGDDAPLICAACAEKRQVPYEYDEVTWEKREDNSYIGIPTGRTITLPKFEINETGQIPMEPAPYEGEYTTTNQLLVDLSDISESYSSGATTMIPACICESKYGDSFYTYNGTPEEKFKEWEKLPTR